MTNKNLLLVAAIATFTITAQAVVDMDDIRKATANNASGVPTAVTLKPELEQRHRALVKEVHDKSVALAKAQADYQACTNDDMKIAGAKVLDHAQYEIYMAIKSLNHFRDMYGLESSYAPTDKNHSY